MENNNIYWYKIGKKKIKTDIDTYFDDVYRKVDKNYKYIEIQSIDIENKTITLFCKNLKEDISVYNSNKTLLGNIEHIHENKIKLNEIEDIKDNMVIIEEKNFLYSIKKGDEYIKILPEKHENDTFILFENPSVENINENKKTYINSENIIIFLITLGIGFVIGNNIEKNI